jgi:hypothetical protein
MPRERWAAPTAIGTARHQTGEPQRTPEGTDAYRNTDAFRRPVTASRITLGDVLGWVAFALIIVALELAFCAAAWVIS